MYQLVVPSLVHDFPFEFDLVNINQHQFVERALNQHGIGTCHAYLTSADDCAFPRAANRRGRNGLPIGDKEAVHDAISSFLVLTFVINFSSFSIGVGDLHLFQNSVAYVKLILQSKQTAL